MSFADIIELFDDNARQSFTGDPTLPEPIFTLDMASDVTAQGKC